MGSGICQHGRQNSKCVDCGGSGICEHDRQKKQCVRCGGSGICLHKTSSRFGDDPNFA